MKHRLVRLGLVGALALAVAGPATQSASAFACAPGFEAICFVVGTACRPLERTILRCEFG